MTVLVTLTIAEQTLLYLVRTALVSNFEIKADPNVNWREIYSLATRQGVSAIVLDAIGCLPSDQRPDKKTLMAWIGHVAMLEHSYVKYKAQIVSLAQFYAKHGIKVLLLKGYGCSLCWPKPEHRPVGDVDIYLFGRQEEADRFTEQELGISVHRKYHKHSTFDYHGVEVENHAKFIDDVSHKSNIRFEQTLMALLKEEECQECPIDNVLLPPTTFNALFLLRHTGEHFASNEITLRQVIDVGTFFMKHHSKIDWSVFYDMLQGERMTDFFNGIATICIDRLGMDATCFSSANDRYGYKKDPLLADRMLADMFQKKEALPMSTAGIRTTGQKLRYGIAKSRRWWHNRWKYRLVYNESLVESFVWLARNRLFH